MGGDPREGSAEVMGEVDPRESVGVEPVREGDCRTLGRIEWKRDYQEIEKYCSEVYCH